MPPLSAMPIAMRDSVTVSMSAEMIGKRSCNPGAREVARSASRTPASHKARESVIAFPLRLRTSAVRTSVAGQPSPSCVAQSMGADLTLAVHLETAKLEPTAALSSFGVLGRSVNVVVAANELRSMEKADILIPVPLEGFDSLEYNRAEELIKLGYEAAQAKAALLNTLSVDESTWQAYLAQRAARRLAVPVPQFVQVAGTGHFVMLERPEEFNRLLLAFLGKVKY